MFVRVLPRVSNIEVAVDRLYIKRGKTLGNLSIYESRTAIDIGEMDGIELCVIDLDTARSNICHVKVRWSTSPPLRSGCAFIHGFGGSRRIVGVRHDDECIVGKILRIDSRTPGDNRSIFG